MTNTPGWASPGSSDSPEPDDGDSPTAPPPKDSAQDSAPSPQTPRGTWSRQQPPPGQWHTPSSSTSSAAPTTTSPPAPDTSNGGTAGPSGQARPGAGDGWARWAPPPSAQRPPTAGPRWGTAAGGWQQQGPWSKPPAPKPGVIPLRPLGVGEILDGAIATLRRYWRSILGVTFAVALVTEGVGVVVQGLFIDDTRIKNLRDNPDPSVGDIMHGLSGVLAGSGLTLLVALIGMLFATAMLTMVTSRAVLGRTVTVSEAWRDARPRLPHLIGLTLLLPLIACGILAVSVLPGALIALAGAEDGGAALASLGLLGGFVVVIWLWVQWSLASPALMLEKQGVVAAMKRSAKLVRGTWWRILGVQLLGVVLAYIASYIIEVPFTILAAGITGDSYSSFLSTDGNPGWTFLIITGVGAVVGSTITLPVSAGVTTLLYMDQRIRRESLDIDLMNAAKGN